MDGNNITMPMVLLCFLRKKWNMTSLISNNWKDKISSVRFQNAKLCPKCQIIMKPGNKQNNPKYITSYTFKDYGYYYDTVLCVYH